MVTPLILRYFKWFGWRLSAPMWELPHRPCRVWRHGRLHDEARGSRVQVSKTFRALSWVFCQNEGGSIKWRNQDSLELSQNRKLNLLALGFMFKFWQQWSTASFSFSTQPPMFYPGTQNLLWHTNCAWLYRNNYWLHNERSRNESGIITFI